MKKSGRTAKRATKATARPKKGKPAPAAPPETTPTTMVTAHLAVSDARKAIAWYEEAFGAKEVSRNVGPGNRIMHATLQIGSSLVYVSDVFPGSDIRDPERLGGSSVSLHLRDPDIDRVWQQAVDAGANVTMQLADQFWGERFGKVIDPFGHVWTFGYPAKMSEYERERLHAKAMQAFAAGAHPGRVY
jgi:PhnB protein